MLILFEISIKNRKMCLNKLLNKEFIQIIKRFTGNKPVGHVHKLLKNINKSKDAINSSNMVKLGTITEIANEAKISPQSSAITPLPERILNNFDEHKGVFGYLTFCLNALNLYPKVQQKTSISTRKNIEKNVEEAFYDENKIILTKSLAPLGRSLKDYERILLEQSFGFLWDNTLPGTPIMRLAILQRFGILPKIARGNVYEVFHKYIINYNDESLNYAARKIIIENNRGSADANFITELFVSFAHVQFIHKYFSKNIIETYTLLHSTVSESPEEKSSFYFTGQKNCDIKLKLYTKNQPLFLDIKQKEINASDFNYNFLKMIYYLETGFENETILDSYLKGVYATLENFQDDDNNLKMLLKFIDPESHHINAKDKILAIHRFVLENYDKAYARVSIMVIQEIYISEHHQTCLKLYSNNENTLITKEIFKSDKPKLFREFVDVFQYDPVYSELKQKQIEAGYALINSWGNSVLTFDS